MLNLTEACLSQVSLKPITDPLFMSRFDSNIVPPLSDTWLYPTVISGKHDVLSAFEVTKDLSIHIPGVITIGEPRGSVFYNLGTIGGILPVYLNPIYPHQDKLSHRVPMPGWVVLSQNKSPSGELLKQEKNHVVAVDHLHLTFTVDLTTGQVYWASLAEVKENRFCTLPRSLEEVLSVQQVPQTPLALAGALSAAGSADSEHTEPTSEDMGMAAAEAAKKRIKTLVDELKGKVELLREGNNLAAKAKRKTVSLEDSDIDELVSSIEEACAPEKKRRTAKAGLPAVDPAPPAPSASAASASAEAPTDVIVCDGGDVGFPAVPLVSAPIDDGDDNKMLKMEEEKSVTKMQPLYVEGSIHLPFLVAAVELDYTAAHHNCVLGMTPVLRKDIAAKMSKHGGGRDAVPLGGAGSAIAWVKKEVNPAGPAAEETTEDGETNKLSAQETLVLTHLKK